MIKPLMSAYDPKRCLPLQSPKGHWATVQLDADRDPLRTPLMIFRCRLRPQILKLDQRPMPGRDVSLHCYFE